AKSEAMKNLFSAFALLVSISSIGQPPEMLAVNNNLFADDTEITIKDWYVFMWSVSNEDNDYGLNDFSGSDFPSISIMPDTTSMDSYFKFIFRNAARGVNSDYEGPNYIKKDITSFRSMSAAWFVVTKG